MAELISEPIMPRMGDSALSAMARGEPGLPLAFVWRDETYDVIEQIAAWKATSTEGGHAKGDRYLRRHYHKLRMSDDTEWTVYFVRQASSSGNPKARWFLYTIDV